MDTWRSENTPENETQITEKLALKVFQTGSLALLVITKKIEINKQNLFLIKNNKPE